MCTEGKVLGVGPLEKRDEIFGREGAGTREAAETRCPCSGSGMALVEKTVGETRLEESVPLGVGVELGALPVLVHEVVEIFDSGVLRYDPVGWRHLPPVPIDGLNGMGVGGSIVHDSVIGKDAEE